MTSRHHYSIPGASFLKPRGSLKSKTQPPPQPQNTITPNGNVPSSSRSGRQPSSSGAYYTQEAVAGNTPPARPPSASGYWTQHPNPSVNRFHAPNSTRPPSVQRPTTTPPASSSRTRPEANDTRGYLSRMFSRKHTSAPVHAEEKQSSSARKRRVSQAFPMPTAAAQPTQPSNSAGPPASRAGYDSSPQARDSDREERNKQKAKNERIRVERTKEETERLHAEYAAHRAMMEQAEREQTAAAKYRADRVASRPSLEERRQQEYESDNGRRRTQVQQMAQQMEYESDNARRRVQAQQMGQQTSQASVRQEARQSQYLHSAQVPTATTTRATPHVRYSQQVQAPQMGPRLNGVPVQSSTSSQSTPTPASRQGQPLHPSPPARVELATTPNPIQASASAGLPDAAPVLPPKASPSAQLFPDPPIRNPSRQSRATPIPNMLPPYQPPGTDNRYRLDREAAERDALLSRERERVEKEREAAKFREAEREAAEREAALARERERNLELEKRREAEREAEQRELQQRQERDRERELERERRRVRRAERERRKELEAERERLEKQAERDRQKELERAERDRRKELEKAERERQKQMERAEREQARALEMERERQQEADRLRRERKEKERAERERAKATLPPVPPPTMLSQQQQQPTQPLNSSMYHNPPNHRNHVSTHPHQSQRFQHTQQHTSTSIRHTISQSNGNQGPETPPKPSGSTHTANPVYVTATRLPAIIIEESPPSSTGRGLSLDSPPVPVVKPPRDYSTHLVEQSIPTPLPHNRPPSQLGTPATLVNGVSQAHPLVESAENRNFGHIQGEQSTPTLPLNRPPSQLGTAVAALNGPGQTHPMVGSAENRHPGRAQGEQFAPTPLPHNRPPSQLGTLVTPVNGPSPMHPLARSTENQNSGHPQGDSPPPLTASSSSHESHEEILMTPASLDQARAQVDVKQPPESSHRTEKKRGGLLRIFQSSSTRAAKDKEPRDRMEASKKQPPVRQRDQRAENVNASRSTRPPSVLITAAEPNSHPTNTGPTTLDQQPRQQSRVSKHLPPPISIPPPPLSIPYHLFSSRSRRYRTMSSASMEAVDGTANNTVVGSPTSSRRSPTPSGGLL